MIITGDDGRTLQFAVEEYGVRVRVDSPGVEARSLLIRPEHFEAAERGLADAIIGYQERARA